jgi:hypothetical protein
MRIEQQLPALDLTHPSANYTTRAAMQRGRGFRGQGSSFGGRSYFRGRGASSSNRGRRSYFHKMLHFLPSLYVNFAVELATPLLGATKGWNLSTPSSNTRKPISKIPRHTTHLLSC